MPDGVTAFVKSDDTEVRPYDLESGKTGDPLPHVGNESGPYAILTSSADGQYLAHVSQPLVGDDDKSMVGVYDVATKALRSTPVSITPHAAAAAFSADGTKLFVLQFPYGLVSVFDTTTGRRVGEIPEAIGTEEGGVSGLLALPGSRMVVGTYFGELRIVDTTSLQVTKSIIVPKGSAIFITHRCLYRHSDGQGHRPATAPR